MVSIAETRVKLAASLATLARCGSVPTTQVALADCVEHGFDPRDVIRIAGDQHVEFTFRRDIGASEHRRADIGHASLGMTLFERLGEVY